MFVNKKEELTGKLSNANHVIIIEDDNFNSYDELIKKLNEVSDYYFHDKDKDELRSLFKYILYIITRKKEFFEADKHQKLAYSIIGPYGMGKSHLLKYIGFVFEEDFGHYGLKLTPKNNNELKKFRKIKLKMLSKKLDLQFLNDLSGSKIIPIKILLTENLLLDIEVIIWNYLIKTLSSYGIYVQDDFSTENQVIKWYYDLRGGPIEATINEKLEDEFGLNANQIDNLIQKSNDESNSDFKRIKEFIEDFAKKAGVQFKRIDHETLLQKIEDIQKEHKINGFIFLFDEFSAYLDSDHSKINGKLGYIQGLISSIFTKKLNIVTILSQQKDMLNTNILSRKSVSEELQKIAGRLNVYLVQSNVTEYLLKHKVLPDRNYSEIIKVVTSQKFRNFDNSAELEQSYPFYPKVLKLIIENSDYVGDQNRNILDYIGSSVNSWIKDQTKDIYDLIPIDNLFDIYISKLNDKTSEQTFVKFKNSLSADLNNGIISEKVFRNNLKILKILMMKIKEGYKIHYDDLIKFDIEIYELHKNKELEKMIKTLVNSFSREIKFNEEYNILSYQKISGGNLDLNEWEKELEDNINYVTLKKIRWPKELFDEVVKSNFVINWKGMERNIRIDNIMELKEIDHKSREINSKFGTDVIKIFIYFNWGNQVLRDKIESYISDDVTLIIEGAELTSLLKKQFKSYIIFTELRNLLLTENAIHIHDKSLIDGIVKDIKEFSKFDKKFKDNMIKDYKDKIDKLKNRISEELRNQLNGGIIYSSKMEKGVVMERTNSTKNFPGVKFEKRYIRPIYESTFYKHPEITTTVNESMAMLRFFSDLFSDNQSKITGDAQKGYANGIAYPLSLIDNEVSVNHNIKISETVDKNLTNIKNWLKDGEMTIKEVVNKFKKRPFGIEADLIPVLWIMHGMKNNIFRINKSDNNKWIKDYFKANAKNRRKILVNTKLELIKGSDKNKIIFESYMDKMDLFEYNYKYDKEDNYRKVIEKILKIEKKWSRLFEILDKISDNNMEKNVSEGLSSLKSLMEENPDLNFINDFISNNFSILLEELSTMREVFMSPLNSYDEFYDKLRILEVGYDKGIFKKLDLKDIVDLGDYRMNFWRSIGNKGEIKKQYSNITKSKKIKVLNHRDLAAGKLMKIEDYIKLLEDEYKNKENGVEIFIGE